MTKRFWGIAAAAVMSFSLLTDTIAPQIKACQKDEGREEIYQGRKPQEYSCIARLSDAEKFSIWQVLLARFSWGSNNMRLLM